MTLAGVGRGDPVALVAPPDHGIVVVTGAGAGATNLTGLTVDDVRDIEATTAPRWVWWSAPATAAVLDRIPLARAFDLAAVHRLAHGGWRAEPAVMWARANGLDTETVPAAHEPDLFDLGPSPEELTQPVGPDGHLRPEWPARRVGDHRPSTRRDGGPWPSMSRPPSGWSCTIWRPAIRRPSPPPTPSRRPRSCASSSGRDGLPVDRDEAERIISSIVGPRPRSAAAAVAQRDERDAAVLRHAPAGTVADLRNPAQVRSLLRRIGVEVPDTRAWRLEQVRDAHPLVDALLAWRRIERTATTYGYGWLDEHVGADGRLRGQWTGSDGAAGRMTATAGLHSMPADLRPAIVAEPGHVFVRADLGQIEPRVLAAVSGDACAGPGHDHRRPLRPGGRPARRRPADGEGRRARRDVRPDDRPRRPGAAPAGRRLPRGHGLPPRGRRRRAGRARRAHLRRAG